MAQSDSEFIAHEPCPKCGSSNNLARYSDGHAHCFTDGCGYYEVASDNPQPRRKPKTAAGLIDGHAVALKSRGLTEATCSKWRYVCNDEEQAQVANYLADDGQLIVGQKLRYRDKKFSVRGDISGRLYGRWLWRDKGRRVIVTEGEIDALTVSQVLEHRWQVVSLPNGVQSARKTLAANFEWLNGFEQIVLCFDMDDAGREAIEPCATLFQPGKVRVVNLPMKDPNEMLVAGRTEELVRALWDAKEYRPDGIKTIADVRDQLLQPPRMGLPWVFHTLTEATYGRRYGEAVGLGAGTGIGKTTLLTQQIAADLRDGHNVGAFLFEQMPDETVLRVAGQTVGKTFHIPDGTWKREELIEAVDALADAPAKLHLYDHFGACEWPVVRDRIRYLRHAHNTRLFYLDHLTAFSAAEDDERRGLDKIMAELGLLVKELDCWLLFVSHLATPEGKSHEEGGRVMAKHFKGSRAIMQWSHFMIGLERDNQADDLEERQQTRLRVLKDRYTGRSTGLTFSITYDPTTGLLRECDPWVEPEGGDDF